MQLEDFKQQWQQTRIDSGTRDQRTLKRLDRTRRKIRRERWGATLSLVPTMFFIAWVGWYYHESFGGLFLASIGLTELLITSALLALWLPRWRSGPAPLAQDQRAYVQYERLRLLRQRWIALRFMPVYVGLLGLFISGYTWEVLQRATPTVRWLGTGGLAFCFVIGLALTVRSGRRRVRERLDPLLEELGELTEDSAEAGN